MTRVLIVTGAAGAGRTTVAAASAARAAADGLGEVLLLGADGTRGLESVLGVPLSTGPSVVAGPLQAACVDARTQFEQEFLRWQDHLATALAMAGVEPLEPEEITPVPGGGDLLALLDLRRHVESGTWDLIVADLPAADRAVLTLALPEGLARYVDRLLPVERQAARSLRPLLATVTGVPMPDAWLFDTARRIGAELGALRALVDGPDTSVRFVARPDSTGASEARQHATALALHGCQVDDVVVNLVLPQGSSDAWLRERAAAQREALAEISDVFTGTTLVELAAQPADPLGPDALAALGQLLPPVEAVIGTRAGREAGERYVVERDGDHLVLLLPLPGAERRDLDLVRRGDELVVTIGAYRRHVLLPSALRRCEIAGAALRDGGLRVRFVPDPRVWRRS